MADLVAGVPKAGLALDGAGFWPGVAPPAAGAVPTEEDAELVSAVRAGSEEAFDRLIQRFHGSVYSAVYRLLGDPSEAEDTVQDVFLKVFRGLGRFHGQASLKTWIFRIAVHESSNRRRWWRRHRARETSLETRVPRGPGESVSLAEVLVEEGRSPFDQTSSEEARRAVDRALRELPEPYRTAVVLRDLEEFSYEEMGEVLEVSLGTVKSRVARGREALRHRLAYLLPPQRCGTGLRPVRASRGEPRRLKACATRP